MKFTALQAWQLLHISVHLSTKGKTGEMHLNISKQLGCCTLAILGQQVLLELADRPLHASVLIILLILLLDCHIGQVHVQVLHVGLVQGVAG